LHTDGKPARVTSFDIMRGVIMVVMALDHTRDYWSNAEFDPTDPSTTTAAYFVTRWITHLCAPWFMLLAGAGAALSLGRGRDKAAITRFLITRGVWLIALELTVVNFAWKITLYDPTFVRAMVLCALGGSMIALAALVHLPRWAIFTIALAIIVGHDALDGVAPEQLGSFAWLWKILHVPGVIGAQPHHGMSVFVLYPLLPWIGVMALGYASAPWLASLEPRRRAKSLVVIGVALVGAFAIMRGLDIYGDPQPRETDGDTVMAFFALSKYPPSLDFLLATIGVGALVLAGIEATVHWRPWQVFRTFGRVPMFYYLVHIPLITVSFELTHRIVAGAWRTENETWGFGLPVIYALWVGYVVALYPLCRWFERVKDRRRDWWLGYI
jgi:uncharacterized membrane protein